METHTHDAKDFLSLVVPPCPAGHAEVALDLGRADLADMIEKHGLQCPVCLAQPSAEFTASVRQFAKWVQRVGAPGHAPIAFRVAAGGRDGSTIR
jgi:hypothetical protein